MVKHKDLTPKAEIAVLERLSQRAASWLVGLTARSLRGHVEIPRDPDGRYHAHVLGEWLKRRAAAAGGDSGRTKEALEREKLRKITLSNDKAEGILRPARDVHELLFGLASALKSAGEAYQRRFGIDGAIILNDVLDKFDEELKALQTPSAEEVK